MGGDCRPLREYAGAVLSCLWRGDRNARPGLALVAACSALACLLGCKEPEAALKSVSGEITADPLTLEFGELPLRGSKEHRIRLSSTGNDAVEVISLELVGGDLDFTFDASPFTLNPGSSIELPVIYAPSDVGSDSDEIVILTNAKEGAEFHIAIHGQAYDPCRDTDQDGYGVGCPAGPDCNDNDPEISPGRTEHCDGVDDDCGGEIDEEYFVGIPCMIPDVPWGEGTCDRPGIRTCAADRLSADCVEIAGEELCDAADNDCDGTIDEGFDVGGGCIVAGTAANGNPCERPGRWACTADGDSTNCIPFSRPPELCNSKDDNCDGQTDEIFEDLGDACNAREAGCLHPGQRLCTGDGRGTACVPDPARPPECCPAPEVLNGDDECCPQLPTTACRYSCVIEVDPEDSTIPRHTCGPPIAVPEIAVRTGLVGLLTVDLSGYAGLEAELELCDPSGFSFHLADSSFCTARGGDGLNFSNDAELVVQGERLLVYGSDYSPAGSPSPLESHTGFAPTGCTTRTLWVTDQGVLSFDPCVSLTGEHLLRIDPPIDDQGTPDGRWFLGLGRTYSDAGRTGTGLNRVTLCLR